MIKIDKEIIGEILKNFPEKGKRRVVEERIEDIEWLRWKLKSLDNRVQQWLQPELAEFYTKAESFLDTTKEMMKREKVKKMEKEDENWQKIRDKVRRLYKWKVRISLRALEEKLKLLIEIKEK